MKKQKIISRSKPMTIAQLIRKYPKLGKNLAMQGYHCSGCPLARYETLSEGALAHGMAPSTFRKLMPSRSKKKKNKPSSIKSKKYIIKAKTHKKAHKKE
jgi:hybrid cluster-associated redox disulfide protein